MANLVFVRGARRGQISEGAEGVWDGHYLKPVVLLRSTYSVVSWEEERKTLQGWERLLWFCSLWDGCESLCWGLTGSPRAQGWKGWEQVLMALWGSGPSLGLRKEEKNNSLYSCPTSSPASPDFVPSAGAMVSRTSTLAALETFSVPLTS